MTATNGHPYARTPADYGPTRHVLLRDDRGRLTLRRLRLWHRLLARCTAARLDRELAAGTGPETSPTLAARAIQLTSMRLRRDLAGSVHRILTAAGEPPAVILSTAAAGPQPRLPLCRARIRQSAELLAQLAGDLAVPGPVPARGVAMASQLLAEGTGPLYYQGCGEDLGHILHAATQALTRLPPYRAKTRPAGNWSRPPSSTRPAGIADRVTCPLVASQALGSSASGPQPSSLS